MRPALRSIGLGLLALFQIANPVHQAHAAASELRLQVPAGTELRSRQGWEAPVIAVLPACEVTLTGLGLGGWVEVGAPAPGADHPITGWLDRTSPERWPPSPAATLARARRLLGNAAVPERRVGPFAAASDLEVRRTWAFLDRLAGAVPEAYAERYGLGVEKEPAASERRLETVVIFSDEEDYRRLFPAGDGRAGQAGDGFAILYLGRRSRSEAGTTLVHEIAHLLNRRMLGPDLPPWLDEGLAEDMALARIGAGGGLDLSPLTARTLRTSSGRRLHGPLLHLDTVAARAADRTLPSLEHLTALDRPAFDRDPDRDLTYALYGFWVRYLMEDDQRAAAFRRYLSTYPRPVSPPDLLGGSWQELDRSFSRWLIDLPRRLDLLALDP